MPDPIEAIKFRIEQYGHTSRECSIITGIKPSHLSEVLNRKSEIINQLKISDSLNKQVNFIWENR